MLRMEVWAKTRSWAPSAHGVSDGSELASGVLCSSGQRVGEEDRTLRKGNRCAPSSRGSECFEKGVANEGLEKKPAKEPLNFIRPPRRVGRGRVGRRRSVVASSSPLPFTPKFSVTLPTHQGL